MLSPLKRMSRGLITIKGVNIITVFINLPRLKRDVVIVNIYNKLGFISEGLTTIIGATEVKYRISGFRKRYCLAFINQHKTIRFPVSIKIFKVNRSLQGFNAPVCDK